MVNKNLKKGSIYTMPQTTHYSTLYVPPKITIKTKYKYDLRLITLAIYRYFIV